MKPLATPIDGNPGLERAWQALEPADSADPLVAARAAVCAARLGATALALDIGASDAPQKLVDAALA